MKKCITCDNTFEQEKNYVCRKCYQEVKKWKKQFEDMEMTAEECKQEFLRWKRNSYLSRKVSYKNVCIIKAIACAEIYKELTKDSKYINWALSLNKKIEENSEETKKQITFDEEMIEQIFEEENKDESVDLKDYKTRYICKDGHRVISKSERDIDNLLFELGIMQLKPL